MVLALYDCRSKQEYIYRTNKIKEISGGSALLASVYEMFIYEAEKNGITFFCNGKWANREFSLNEFEKSEKKAVVVYIGGGNLMVIYKDKEDYINANKIFSRLMLEKTYTINVISAYTEVTGDFKGDRSRLYAQNAKNKNVGMISMPWTVFPFTQVDPRTSMPVVMKDSSKQESLSRESVLKCEKYSDDHRSVVDEKLKAIYLDDLAYERGEESILAVIYIDGNNMGAKIKDLLDKENSYNECINKIRTFSIQTDRDFVDSPIKAIEKALLEKRCAWEEKNKADGKKRRSYFKYRKVIAGGDEITLICNARMVPIILETYFDALNSEESGNYACAGVALFHSHAPFSKVYEIAEQCCESGKKRSRAYDSKANFVDFHYCRTGITNNMETIRDEQEKDLTARPFLYGEPGVECRSDINDIRFDDFEAFGKLLAGTDDVGDGVGRANIKELAASLLTNHSKYEFEMIRIRSRLTKDEYKELVGKMYPETDEKKKEVEKLLFDIAQVYDLWFATERGE
ncbi:MAG: hypothetical protein IJ141_05625 [Lachnospiraceae bacterium]|nr:hypothetical protein [Lachnospiraceae bacterium]